MKKLSLMLLFLLLGVFLAAGSAWATPILKLSDGTNTVSITDGGTGDQSSAEGAVTYNGYLGDFIVNVTTGLTKPLIGSANYPRMDLNSVNVSGGAGTLTISWTETDFTLPDTIPGFLSEVGGTSDGKVEVNTYLDNSNAPFGQSTSLSDLGAFVGGAFSASDSILINPTDPFSLTIVAAVTHTVTGQVSSFDAGISPVPEPATMLLFGVGLCGLAFVGRKKLIRHR